MIKTPKLAEIASRLTAHLKRLEREQANPGSLSARYYNPGAHASGSRITVWYISYQMAQSLTKAEAWNYLQWLDAGNTGTHFDFRKTEDGQ